MSSIPTASHRLQHESKAKFLVPNLMTAARAAIAMRARSNFRDGEFLKGEVLLALAMATDVLDGFTARRLNATSKFGSQADVVADLLLLASSSVAMWEVPHTRTVVLASMIGSALNESGLIPTVLGNDDRSFYGKASLGFVYLGTIMTLEGERRSQSLVRNLGLLSLWASTPLLLYRFRSR